MHLLLTFRRFLFLVFRCICKIAKATNSFDMSVCLSVRSSFCPHAITRLPLDGFSRNMIFEYYSEICRENSSFIKI